MVLPNVHSLGYKAGKAVYTLIETHHLPEIPPLRDVWDFVCSLPYLYREWWLTLVTKDPVHVFVETTLLLSVVYMLISQKSRDWREDTKDRLTKAEEEELLRQWKDHERVELAPTDDGVDMPNVIVHAVRGRTMDIQEGDNGDIKTVLNFATHDFLGMSSSTLTFDKEDGPGVAVKEASRKALARYGCGSCGPRGFYGTIDVHLDLEDAISKYTQTEGAIMYSDAASTVSSTIAAFAKRGDLLVVDDGVYEPIVTGVSLSRANVKWFRHNDMVSGVYIFFVSAPLLDLEPSFAILDAQDDLRRVLNEIKANDKRLGRNSNDQRRFIVVEGLYKNSGTIVPFEELAALKHAVLLPTDNRRVLFIWDFGRYRARSH